MERSSIDCGVHCNGDYVLTLSVISIWLQLTILLAFMNTPILFITSKLGVHDIVSIMIGCVVHSDCLQSEVEGLRN